MKFGNRICNQIHRLTLPAADIDVAGDVFTDGVEFGFRFLHQRHDLLGAAAQQHPFRRQRDMVGFAVQEFLPEFLLQIHHLTRKRRLGHMQVMGRPGKAVLPRHSQKIT